MAQLNGKEILLAGLKGEQGASIWRGRPSGGDSGGQTPFAVFVHDNARLPKAGDYVLNFDTGDLYLAMTDGNAPAETGQQQKFSNCQVATSPVGSLKGPQGEKGEKGDKGDPGEAPDAYTKEEADDLLAEKVNVLPSDSVPEGQYVYWINYQRGIREAGLKKLSDFASDEDLAGKQDKPSVGSFSIFLDLSKEADSQLCQGVMAGYNWSWNSLSGLLNTSQIQGSFATQAQTFEAGKTYLALFGGYDTDNLRASVFTVGSDGSSITWNDAKRWEIPIGARIVMPNGAVYLYVAKPTAVNSPIYECVKPISGKIPLSISSNSTINVKGLENVEATLASTTTTWQAAVRFTDCKDSNFHVDLSQMGYSDGSAGSQCIFSFSEGGKPIQPLIFNSYGLAITPQTNGQSADSIVNSSGTASNVPVMLFAENPKIDLVNGRWQAVLYARHSQYVTSDGKFVRRDFNINFLGGIPMFSPTYAEEGSSPSAQAAMMKARSLSVEPSISEEDFNNAIKGKKGIFTVKDGRPFDLMTNDYAD